MKVTFFGKTDIGKVRRGNEDYFYNEQLGEDEYLFIVADGMGGHLAGDVASRLGTHTFVDIFRSLRASGTHIMDSMLHAVREANSAIIKKATADASKRGMGTTFSALAIKGDRGYIVHVGDSRIYRVRDGEIKKITTDHTFVEKMVEEGRITELEARDHPQKNILYMSLGARERFIPESIDDLPIFDGDTFVICSDGLSNMLTDPYIAEVCQNFTVDEAVIRMVETANRQGGMDNITVQVINAGEPGDLSKTEPIQLPPKRSRIGIALFYLGLILAILAVYFIFSG
jgi:protein phosphatase